MRTWVRLLVLIIVLIAVFLVPAVASAAPAGQTGPPANGLPFTNWEQFLTFGVVPLVIALVALLKYVVPGYDRLYPVAALVLGVAFTYVAGVRLNYDPLFAFVLGIALGAAASGFYSWRETYRASSP